MENAERKNMADEYERKLFDFIDLASHDLDSPLRKLSSFTERLTAKYKDEQDEQTKTYVQKIQGLISGMRSMIDDMSALSKANAIEIENMDCDLNPVIEKLKKDHSEELETGEVRISSSKLPVVKGDRLQLERLFSNLLDNAIKFRKKNGSLTIKISEEEMTAEEQARVGASAGNLHKIVMEDDGIGFENEFAEKIFEPFVRLHGKSEYPGSGLGLAIAKKIVQNHKGIIYAESQQHHNSRFILILPGNQ